ncbi:MAG: flippase-like domain-containing protein [Deltaproteobacteria bacterium]|nr:flippase-like domain-containing protein [Deltaproteobacteria bacterium]
MSTLLGLGVSLGLVVWMYFAIEWGEVGTQLANSHYWLLIPVSFVMIGHYILRALRWRYLLPHTERVPLRVLFDGIMVGNFANYILPLRAGEFIRPFILSRESSHSFSTGLVSVVIERFFDLATVLLSFAVMVFFIPEVPPIVQQGASALTVVAGALLVFMLVGTLMPKTAERWIDFGIDFLPAKFRPGIKKFCHDFIEGAAVLGEKGRIWKVLALTAAVWLSSYLIMYLYLFVYAAPDHPAAHSLWLALALGVVVALAVAAPSAPGFIGVYQAGCIASFALFGISKEAGAAFAILTHVYQYLFFCLYGIYYLLHGNVSLADLRGAAARS